MTFGYLLAVAASLVDGEQEVAENIEPVRRYHEDDVVGQLRLGGWLNHLGAAHRPGQWGS
jgi:hypothetical protein